MAEREKRGLRDGNDREATIARWLGTPPKAEIVAELVLSITVGDDAPEIVGRWPREDVSESLATTLNNLIVDAANDCGTTVSALLSWCTEDGRPWQSKRFRASCRRDAEEIVRPMDGTHVAILSQTQRHAEILLQRLVEVTLKGDERAERMFGMMDRMLERLAQRAELAEDKASELEASAEEAIALAETAAAEVEAARREAEEAKSDDKLAKVIDLAAKQLTGH